MGDAVADSVVVGRAIEDRVRGLGGALGRATPAGMVVVLAGAALWPIVAPLVGTGTAATMVAGGLGLLGGPGKGFVSGFLKRLATREREGESEPLEPSDVRAELERALRERLQAEGDQAAALREDVSRLLRSVGGVEIALAAAGG